VAGVENLVLIDTNVWKHLVDRQTLSVFRGILKTKSERGAVSPLIVDELVRIDEDAERTVQVTEACQSHWRRLLPIGLLDMMQLAEAIRKHRPEWVRPRPDLKLYAHEKGAYLSHAADGFWQVVRRNSAGYARLNASNEAVRSSQQMTTRHAKLSAILPFDSVDLLTSLTAPIKLDWPNTWSSRTVESWRYQSANLVRTLLRPQLSGPMPSLWLGCFIDLNRIQLQDWCSFWADQISPTEASHFWLRAAVFQLQATRKIGPGVAGDLAIAGHLADVQTFVTLDSAFGEIIERIRQVAPFPVAKAIYARQYPNLIELLG
jgi:hypothetical protein